jgi:hypothetical protein
LLNKGDRCLKKPGFCREEGRSPQDFSRTPVSGGKGDR